MVTAVMAGASAAQVNPKGGTGGGDVAAPQHFEIGSRVLCRASFDGEQHVATIVERRGGNAAASTSSASAAAVAPSVSSFKVPLAYYVHYAHCDKRLEEWVAPGRIASLPAAPGGGGLKHAAAAASNRGGGGGAAAGNGGGGPAINGGGGGAASPPNGANGTTTAAAGAPHLAPSSALGATAAGATAGAGTATAATAAAAAAAASTEQKKMTRRLKRVYDQTHHVSPTLDELPPLDAAAERAHQEKTRLKNIQSIELGRYEVDAWYYSPYPEPFCSLPKLHICEFCLKYFAKRSTLVRHAAKCDARHPPGDEIYRSPPASAALRGDAPASAVAEPAVAVFEVDGKKDKVYCQSLCLLSKLFLDHKTLYYDVDPFLFYVLCEKDAKGYHIVGYFSKEKHSEEGYNLACILTLPPYQRKGYGKFLIAFSYELSKKEGKVGTPERPLSDLGAVSYRSYWTRAVLGALHAHRGNLSIRDLSELTAVRSDDVVKTLESLGLIKYWKGDHIISVTPRVIEEHLRLAAVADNNSGGSSNGNSGSNGNGAGAVRRGALSVDASRLHWTPFVSGKAAATARR